MRTRLFVTATTLSCLAAALAGAPPRAAADPPAAPPPVIVIDRDDIDVTQTTVVKPGTYRVADANGDGVLRIRGANVTLVLDGVVLEGAAPGATPDTFEGVGVAVDQAGAVVRGGTVHGFRVGVRGRGAKGLRLERVNASGTRRMRLKSTPEREDETDWLWPHENDKDEWETRYGGGFSLTECDGAVVEACRAREGQNGVLLTRCKAAAVFDGDFSFNSGWGVAMYRSYSCEVSRNRCDWCVRGYSHGVYARGQDSAGILVFEQCSDNLFAFNSATHSGDGFFLYAGHETTQRTGRGGSNRNRVVRNDFSQAVANGIEATFSQGNEFVGNRLDECDHGVWAGYSYRTRIEGNTMARCANGISIEHGHENRIAANLIEECGLGVHLWWDEDRDLVGGVYGKAQDTSSSRNAIVGNWITGGRTAIRLDGDRDSGVDLNRIAGAATVLDVSGDTSPLLFEGNAIEGRGTDAPLVRCSTKAPLAIGPNHWGGAPPRAEGPQTVVFAPPLPKAPDIALPAAALEGGIRARGSQDAFLRKDAPRGRQFMLIDEWGPVDPRVPRLFPSKQAAASVATLHVLGAGVPFRVTSLSDGFAADPASGTAPATIRVRRKPDAGRKTIAPFAIAVKAGDATLSAEGTVLTTRWKVRWWSWTRDPREDAAAWKALVETPPLDQADLDALDFSWGGGAPTPKVPADRFATVAETTIDVPAGPYALRTVSDDGIRVLLDGKVVLEDWTWHAPKEVSASVTLSAGPHSLRVEHFEIDGHAALRCSVEPIATK